MLSGLSRLGVFVALAIACVASPMGDTAMAESRCFRNSWPSSGQPSLCRRFGTFWEVGVSGGVQNRSLHVYAEWNKTVPWREISTVAIPPGHYLCEANMQFDDGPRHVVGIRWVNYTRSVAVSVTACGGPVFDKWTSRATVKLSFLIVTKAVYDQGKCTAGPSGGYRKNMSCRALFQGTPEISCDGPDCWTPTN